MEGRVSFPIVGMGICHYALHRCRGIVALLSGSLPTVVLWNNHAATIRIEEDFGGIKRIPLGGSKAPSTR